MVIARIWHAVSLPFGLPMRTGPVGCRQWRFPALHLPTCHPSQSCDHFGVRCLVVGTSEPVVPLGVEPNSGVRSPGLSAGGTKLSGLEGNRTPISCVVHRQFTVSLPASAYHERALSRISPALLSAPPGATRTRTAAQPGLEPAQPFRGGSIALSGEGRRHPPTFAPNGRESAVVEGTLLA